MKNFYVHFQNTEGIESFPRPLAAGIESRKSPSYHFDGSERRGHAHCIFQFSLSGYGVFRDAEGAHNVSEGSGFLCESDDAGTAYYFPEESKKEWRFIFLAFTGAMSHEMVRRTVRRYGGVFSIPTDHPVIMKINSYLDYSRPEPVITASAGAKLVSDLIFALVESREEKRSGAPENLLIHKAGKILSQHSKSDINVSELAKFAGVSREHLTRVFRQNTGQTPLQFITKRKLIDACRLLQDGKISIKEVSDSLGYHSPAHFTRTFSRLVGKSPREFRKDGTMPVFT
ncbi:MAG: AraC family transcriptional regulator [Victivallales bacterium]